jgi:signal transduction histidine kinase
VDHRDLEPGVMAIARRALAELCGEGVSEATTQHFALQKIDAEGQLRDLEQSLALAQELERQRAELWREAAHDLRGNLGVVANATAGLTLEGLPEPSRIKFLGLLQRSVAGLHAMLDDVTSLARLQAGHEERAARPFDAAALLRERVETLQGIASQRGLFLKAEGPPSLPVEGDAFKVGRIVQNLLLNALKYTRDGGVTVTWGDSRPNDAERWLISVRDTGPGFRVGGGAPLAAALEEATQEARQIEGNVEERPSNAAEPESPPGALLPPREQRGEGIGLSIVKRLCEILDATLELESEPGVGTTVSVILPRRYPEGGRKQVATGS